jgi:Na+-translocating ferredoxin:NAD+ oxidoreductase subunit C
MTDARPPLLHAFHGGLRLAGHKTVAAAIVPCPLPPRLRVPLGQYAGATATACVAIGERVRHGQRIALAPDLGVDVHAPADGVIVSLPSAGDAHIGIDCDPQQQPPLAHPPLDPWSTDPEQLRRRLREAGIVGLGGAGFPTGAKLAGLSATLILNGAECEPYIACDDALLRERADDVVLGGRLLARLCGATTIVLAVEDTMTEAAAACRSAIERHRVDGLSLVTVPTVYPEGGERQLIAVLTGREVPRDGHPSDIGILVQNVGTAAAAWKAVVAGEVLSARVLSVAGRGVRVAGNFLVAFGTPVAHLVAQAGGYTADAARLLLGGPMMGRALPDDSAPIDKTHNCVLVLGAQDLRASSDEKPCIRCGDCADACPARLQPQQLLWHARAGRDDRLQADGLFACIECGCCDLVCPSHIPLTQAFRDAKTGVRVEQQRRAAATAAGLRHDRRNERLQRLAIERATRDAERAASASSGDAVAAAIERAKARRQQSKDPPR